MAKQIVEAKGQNFNTWLKNQLKEAKQAILIEETSEWHNVIQEAIFDQLLSETLMSTIPKSLEKKKTVALKEMEPNTNHSTNE